MAVAVLGIICLKTPAFAQDKQISVKDGDFEQVSLYLGDTGKIVPDLSGYVQPGAENPSEGESIGEGTEEEEDLFEEYEEYDWMDEVKPAPVRFTYEKDDIWAGILDSAITIDADGKFKTTAPGWADVTIKGYDEDGEEVFRANLTLEITVDMSKISLSKSSATAYMSRCTDGYDSWYEDTVKISLKCPKGIVLNGSMVNMYPECQSSNKNVSVSASLTKNVLSMTFTQKAKKNTTSTITVSMGGKKYKIKVSLNTVTITANSLLLPKGSSKTLKISGYKGKITWSSTNSKIASVSSKGVVKGKKTGNVVITAKFGSHRLGCAVSVTSSSLKKVCDRATYIGTHWKYSQAKRTKNGYYDCSALVWKAYTQYTKINFGSKTYPGTSKSESAWCKKKGKMIGGGFSSSKVKKMQLNPGDIIFKSSNPKKPYDTTYHVEMFTGYTCLGYDSKGKPIVAAKWASRGTGYSVEEGALLARPSK